jgi:hypothetical protein
MQRSEPREDALEQASAIDRTSDVGWEVLDSSAGFRQLTQRVSNILMLPQARERERPSVLQQRARDTEAYAARSACD